MVIDRNWNLLMMNDANVKVFPFLSIRRKFGKKSEAEFLILFAWCFIQMGCVLT